MNCISHQNIEAVRYCVGCNAPICMECATNYNNLCTSCALSNAKKIKGETVGTFVIPIICFLAGFALSLYGEMNNPNTDGIELVTVLLTGLMCAGIPFGWKALSMITSKFFLFLPIVGWLIYFGVKLLLSLFIGWMIAIPKLITVVGDYKTACQVEELIKNAK